MDCRIGSKSVCVRIVSVVLTLGIFFSFGLHSIQTPHTHFDEHGEHESGPQMLGEYMHLADKKLVIAYFGIAPVVSMLFDFARLAMRELFLYAMFWHKVLRVRLQRVGAIGNYLLVFLMRGVIHTKVY